MIGTSLLFAALLAPGENQDRTGVAWALPFAEAKKRAVLEHRLLLIKPIAFGTEKSGAW